MTEPNETRGPLVFDRLKEEIAKKEDELARLRKMLKSLERTVGLGMQNVPKAEAEAKVMGVRGTIANLEAEIQQMRRDILVSHEASENKT
ncbi:MAG: hypothetical protein HY395_00875 [Candidatus Doudnabacteria bacterium]|nr:hypothetical protein [Candidatus Doudnabacteria bacterium]